MDVISNNLANTSTAGFKKVRAEFEDLLSDTIRGAQAPDPRGGTAPTPLQVGMGVRTGTTSRAFAQGELTATQGAAAAQGPSPRTTGRPADPAPLRGTLRSGC
jgi:flagellar basal-body rod protein FlgG